jgi:Protein of unknown function (DUF632)
MWSSVFRLHICIHDNKPVCICLCKVIKVILLRCNVGSWMLFSLVLYYYLMFIFSIYLIYAIHVCYLQTEEEMRVLYDRKCQELRHLDERGAEVHKIEATQAFIRKLSTRISIAIQIVNTISTKISKLRDEELWPQICQFVQGYVHFLFLATFVVSFYIKTSENMLLLLILRSFYIFGWGMREVKLQTALLLLFPQYKVATASNVGTYHF